MIILLKIIAGMSLIPLTVIMIILFNICIVHWGYWFFMLCFLLIYSGFWGFAIFGSTAIGWIFIILGVLYVWRMVYMSYRLSTRQTLPDLYYPMVQGRLKSKVKKPRVELSFFFPLSLLRLVKWLPYSVHQEIKKKMGIQEDLPDVVNQVVLGSIGTHIDVESEEADVYLEIK